MPLRNYHVSVVSTIRTLNTCRKKDLIEADILFSPLPAFINKWDFLFGNMKTSANFHAPCE